MDKTIKVGFIGCGRISNLHQLGYKDNPNATLSAVCCRDQGDLNKVAQTWQVQKKYKEYQDLLEDKEIDLVEILTPHSTHFEITKAALLAKKHVSLQKVPTLTLSEFDELVSLAKQQNVHLRVYENYRYYPPYQIQPVQNHRTRRH